ncbi:hypothetical protein AHAS_Ahas13G0127800 [Arachis hypogaea]
MEGYINWTAHGEERWVEQDARNVTQEHEEENTNPYIDMVIDAAAVTQLVNLKSEFNMSESCYNRMIAIIKSMLPESEKLPEDFYRSKTMIQELGL